MCQSTICFSFFFFASFLLFTSAFKFHFHCCSHCLGLVAMGKTGSTAEAMWPVLLSMVNILTIDGCTLCACIYWWWYASVLYRSICKARDLHGQAGWSCWLEDALRWWEETPWKQNRFYWHRIEIKFWALLKVNTTKKSARCMHSFISHLRLHPVLLLQWEHF